MGNNTNNTCHGFISVFVATTKMWFISKSQCEVPVLCFFKVPTKRWRSLAMVSPAMAKLFVFSRVDGGVLSQKYPACHVHPFRIFGLKQFRCIGSRMLMTQLDNSENQIVALKRTTLFKHAMAVVLSTRVSTISAFT